MAYRPIHFEVGVLRWVLRVTLAVRQPGELCRCLPAGQQSPLHGAGPRVLRQAAAARLPQYRAQAGVHRLCLPNIRGLAGPAVIKTGRVQHSGRLTGVGGAQ